MLRNWKKRVRAADGTVVVSEHFAQEEEIRRLRRELLRVT